MTTSSYFHFQGTSIFKVVNSPMFSLLKQGKKWGRICLVVGSLLSIFLATQFIGHYVNLNLKTWIGVDCFILALALINYYNYFFFTTRLIHPRLKIPLAQVGAKDNLASFLDYESAQILSLAMKNKTEDLAKVPSFALAPFLSKHFPIINFTFYRLGLGPEQFGKAWQKIAQEKISLAVGIETILQGALNNAVKEKHQRIQLSDILGSLAQHDVFFAQVLMQHNLDSNDFINVVNWFNRSQQEREQRRKFWTFNNLIRKGSLAANWAAAYTLTIDKYSTNWTNIAQVQSQHLDILGHQKELKQVEDILAKSGLNNVLLVGQPGSGRKDIVLALASKSFWGTSLPKLRKKRVLELNLGEMINEITSPEEVALTLEKCFQEAITAGNVILIIDNLENYLGGETTGVIDISSTLARYLNSSRFQIIALASYRGLHQRIEKKPNLMNLFSKVEVEPLNASQTLKLLEVRLPNFESHYRQFVLYPTLKKIVSYSARYLQEKPFPQKALDLLDEVLVYANRTSSKERVVWPYYVDQVITQKTQIPVGQMVSSERNTLANLENLLHQTVINQNEAIQDIASALRRARTEVTAERNKPMGSFLFLGPTGVGKTQTAKALAKVYFGSTKRIVRMDMAEFQKLEDIKRFIGDENRPGLLTSQVRENPFSLVLLDEIEKAHPDILNLFLTVLDEGYLTDSWGRQISFADTVIIATSNAGAELIWKDIQQDKALNLVKDDLLNYLINKNTFRPEFINRFDALVVFRPLTPENLLAIAQLKLGELKTTLQQSHKIDLVITEKLKESIARLGYNPSFGARAMNRVIQNKVENSLAKAILSRKIKRGDRIEIDPNTFQVKCLSSSLKI